MKRKLTYYGNPILRTKCEPIGEIDDEVRQIAQDLIDSMDAYQGAGLAAPQIGVLKRIFVCCYVGDDEEGNPVMGKPFIVINPEITPDKSSFRSEVEGCLSIPGMRGSVVRPFAIEVAYTTLEGVRITEKVSGWRARCILHENDHINGTLFVDRLAPNDRRALEPKLRLLKKKYS